MIDVHAHVLPGLDDGPPDEIATLAMARAAVAHGICEMVATPHVREDHPNRAPEIRRAVGRLQALLDAEGTALTVRPGGEVAMGPALELEASELRALTLAGGGTLLLETPHGPLPSVFESLVERLQDQGLRVLLAHPELNPDLQAQPERLGRLVDAGALVQVTAASLQRGRARHRALALEALERGWVHVLSSDAHSADWRPPDLAVARPAAGALFAWLTVDVPDAVLRGRELPERPLTMAERPRARWGWRR